MSNDLDFEAIKNKKIADISNQLAKRDMVKENRDIEKADSLRAIYDEIHQLKEMQEASSKNEPSRIRREKITLIIVAITLILTVLMFLHQIF